MQGWDLEAVKLLLFKLTEFPVYSLRTSNSKIARNMGVVKHLLKTFLFFGQSCS
jgi:hypothetical protein